MSVWQQDRVPGARGRWALGLWLPRRKIASAAWLPGQRAQKVLRGKRAFWLVFPQTLATPGNAAEFVIPSQQTVESRNAVTTDFILLAILISNSVGGTQTNPGCRVQIWDTKAKRRFGVIGVNDICIGGSAQNPFFLRKPYLFRAGNTILARLQNLQTSTNRVQLALYGVMD